MQSADIYKEVCDLRKGFAEADSHPAYRQLLERKTIAVVGPARTVIGRKRGAAIDAHDLVVRFNDTFDRLPFFPELAEDIGTRADILYCNQSVLKNGILRRDGLARDRLREAFDKAGVTFVVCTNNSLSYTPTGDPSPTCSAADGETVHQLQDFLRQQGRTVRVVYGASERLGRWLNGNFPRTGLVGVLDLLGFPVARVHISGMTFYHGGGHLLMPPSAELHPLKNRDGTWARSPDGVGHNSYLEIEIMKLLARGFPDLLTMDEDLSGLLT